MIPTRRATFPLSARLIKPADFKRVFNKPVVSSDRCFKVLARTNEGDGSRLGMAVSRKVDRSAVVRNRIKRVIRESFRQSFPAVVSQPMKDSKAGETARGQKINRNPPGIDIVILPRREAATLSNSKLFRSLEAHWSRIGAAAERLGDPAESPKSGRIKLKQP